MGRSALSEVQTNVTAHVREGRAVRGYKANRLKDLGVEGVGAHGAVTGETFQKEHETVSGSVYDKRGEVRRDASIPELEAGVKRLYSMSGESGIDPTIFSSDDFLSKAFSSYGKESPTTQVIDKSAGFTAKRNEPLFDYVGISKKDALTTLLDKDNIDTIIKSTDGLEKKFQKDFGVKTERVDQFTFKFDHNINLQEISQENTLEYLMKKTDTISKKHGLNLEIDESQSMDDIAREMKKGDRHFSSGGGVAAILPNITGLGGINLPDEHFFNLEDHVNSRNLIGSGNIDLIKKSLTSDLNGTDVGGGYQKDIIDLFSKIDGKHVEGALNYMMSNGKIPDFIGSNPELMKDIGGMVDGARQINEYGKKAGSAVSLYVSRNPMNILTMSPEQSSPSCQSITLNGEMNVNKENMNVPASYNMHTTNDYIMYTLDNKTSQKNARISLTYNPTTKEHINYEEMAVYGSSKIGKEAIKSFVESNNSKIKESSYIEPIMPVHVEQMSDTWMQLQRVEPALNRVYSDFESAVKNGDIDSAREYHQELSKSHDIQKEKKSDVKSRFLDDVNEIYLETVDKHKSLLYGSPASELMKTGKHVGENFSRTISNLDSMYSSSLDEFKKVLSQHT